MPAAKHKSRSRPWLLALKAALALLSLLILLLAAALAFLASQAGRDWALAQANQALGADGRIGALQGSLLSRFSLHDLRLTDAQDGGWLHAPRIDIHWRPLALLAGAISIDSLIAARVEWHRMPQAAPSEADGQPLRIGVPRLPLALAVDAIAIERLETAPALTGDALAFALSGQIRISANELGDSQLRLRPLGDAGDEIDLSLAVDEGGQQAKLEAEISAPRNGLIGRLIGVDLPLLLTVSGDGPINDWQAQAQLTSKDTTIAKLRWERFGASSRLAGDIDPSLLLDPGNRQSLGGRYDIEIDATATTRAVLLLAGRLQGPPGSIGFDGGIGYRAALRFEDMVLTIEPDASQAARIGIAGVAIEEPRIDAVLNGPLAQPLAQARVAAARVRMGDYGAHGLSADLLLSWQDDRAQLALDAELASLDTPLEPVNAWSRAGLALTGEASLNTDTGQIDLAPIRVQAATGMAEASGKLALDLSQLDLGLTAQFDDLDLLAQLTGQSLSGAAELAGRINRADASAPIAADLAAAFQNLDFGDDTLDSLIGRQPRLIVEGQYRDAGHWRVSRAALEGAPLELSGQGHSEEGRIKAQARLAHASYGRLQLGLSGLEAAGHYEITLDGTALDAPLSGRLIAMRNAEGGLAARPLNVDWGNLSLNGELAQQAGGTVAGALDFLLQPDHRARLAGVSGDARGRVAIRYDGAVPVIEASADITALAYDGESGDGPPLLVTGPGRLNATLRLADIPQLDADAALQDAIIADTRLQSLRFEAQNADKRTDFTAEVAFGGLSADRLSLAGSLSPMAEGQALETSLEGQLGGAAVQTESPIALSLLAAGWRLAPVRLTMGAGFITAEAAQTANALRLDVEFDQLPSEALAIATGPLPVNGDLSGNLNLRQDGQGRDGQWRLSLAQWRGAKLVTPSGFALALDGRLDADAATAKLRLAQHADTLFTGQARLPLTSPQPGQWPQPAPDAALSAALTGEGPAAPLWALVPGDEHALTGTLGLDLRLEGPWQAPRAAGELRLSDARYEHLDLGLRLEALDAALGIDGDHLQLNRLRASDGNGGTLSGQGDLYLAPEQGQASAMAISLAKFRILRRDDLRATVSGGMQLARRPQGLRLSGALTVERAEILLSDRGSASIPRVEVREVNVPAYLQRPELETEKALPVALDVSVTAPQKLFFQGLGLNSEWRADLQLSGQLDAPRLSGAMQLVRGEFDFATTRFELERGVLDFDGGDEIDPLLDIAGTSRRDNLTVNMTVGGRASQPNISLGSNPAFPQDEILSRLLFGTSVTDLTPLEAVQLGSAVTALSGGGGGGALNVLNTARSTLGIDRLSLGSGPAGGTTITGGKYLTDDVYLEVTTEPSTGNSSAVVEWDITRRLSLLSRIRQQADANFSIRWSRDY
ncbi:MAG: translocation/assembly module TamB domain-containing protein [Sphingomonadales bacterium]